MRYRTPTWVLAEQFLGEPLEPWIMEKRGRGLSWERIAQCLAEETNGEMKLNRETLRLWFRPEDQVVG